jgi:hypothetical protein
MLRQSCTTDEVAGEAHQAEAQAFFNRSRAA